MGKIIVYTWLLWVALQANAAVGDTIPCQLKKVVYGSFKQVAVDHLSNIYLLNHQNQIKKLNNLYDSVAVYNDVKRFGNIDAIDVSNPMKVLIFYRNYGTIAVLDRFFNYRNTIDLRSENHLQVKAIAQSFDNQIWIFDDWDAKLKKIDDFGKTISETPDLRLALDKSPSPEWLTDYNGQLYLYNAANGWYVFDYLGNLVHQYAIPGWSDVQVQPNGALAGRNQQRWCSWQPKQLKSVEQTMACFVGTKAFCKNNLAYVLQNDGLYIYEIKKL